MSGGGSDSNLTGESASENRSICHYHLVGDDDRRESVIQCFAGGGGAQ